jgi:hypothetical protein
MTAVSYNVSLFSLGPPLKRLVQSRGLFSTINLDDTAVLERRYSALRKSLPPFGTVGYLPVNIRNEEDDILHFFVVKYALSPVLVTTGTDYEYVIGDFHKQNIDPQAIINQMSKDGFQVLQKIDDRLVLFRKNHK